MHNEPLTIFIMQFHLETHCGFLSDRRRPLTHHNIHDFAPIRQGVGAGDMKT